MNYLLIKRFFDIIVALFILILSIPLWLTIVLILSITGEHQIFYLQERVGLNNSRFRIWKFATMLKNSSNIGTGSLTIRNDPRVLPIGKFLRKTKINELPQIINVLEGNMSFVGPRPQMESDFFKYSEKIQSNIYQVKPGITGIGSIIFRDEEMWLSNTNIDIHDFYKRYIAPYKGEVELWYLKNQSFFVDFVILIITFWVVIFPKSNIIYSVFKKLPSKPLLLS